MCSEHRFGQRFAGSDSLSRWLTERGRAVRGRGFRVRGARWFFQDGELSLAKLSALQKIIIIMLLACYRMMLSS